MQVVATPIPVNELGVLMVKLGQHLPGFVRGLAGGRVLVSVAPDGLPVGPVVGGTAPAAGLQADRRLDPVWHGLLEVFPMQRSALDAWVARLGCQLPGEGECHAQLTNVIVEGIPVRLCWIHAHEPGQHIEALTKLAQGNLAAFWLEVIRIALGLPAGHRLSLPELCWYLASIQQTKLLPDSVIRQVLARPASSLRHTGQGWTDTDDLYLPHPGEQLQALAKPVAKLVVDADPPARYLGKPKPKYWACRAYLDYVASLPCCVCGAQGADPHHLIGHGQGKMGGKAHDLFAIPLCRRHHDALHRGGVASWEREHGSQLDHLLRTLDRAMKEGALA